MASRVIATVMKFKDQDFSRGLKRANKNAGEFGRYMQSAQNKATKFNQAASKAFKAVGIAAGALAAGGIAKLSHSVGQMVVEMDEAFNKLEAQTGATGEQLKQFKGLATDVYKNGLVDSVSEGATAVGKLATMFKDATPDELQNITKGSFGIAKAFGQEATEVGRAVKALRTNFDDISATQATDLITVAFQKTGDYANDVLDTFSEYSGYFKDLGFTGEKFTSMLIKGAEAG